MQFNFANVTILFGLIYFLEMAHKIALSGMKIFFYVGLL